ncbi:MAG: hypothetical protein VW274_00475, partial [Thalassolituus sp.]
MSSTGRKKSESKTQEQARLLDGFFLPDLCNTRAVLILLIVSEALVLALTLVESGIRDFSWMRFGLVSMFVQWVALVSVAVLCQLRVVMAKLSVTGATLMSLLVIQVITLGISLLGE